MLAKRTTQAFGLTTDHERLGREGSERPLVEPVEEVGQAFDEKLGILKMFIRLLGYLVGVLPSPGPHLARKTRRRKHGLQGAVRKAEHTWVLQACSVLSYRVDNLG